VLVEERIVERDGEKETREGEAEHEKDFKKHIKPTVPLKQGNNRRPESTGRKF
jgi:hypothetical protein